MMYDLIDLSPVVSMTQQFRDEAILGLLKARKSIAPKFFYDLRGSELFEAITREPEYYPTRAETAILRKHMSKICELLGNQVTLVEFGSGASLKTRLLLNELADPCAYVPIDISRDFLLESSRTLARDYRGLPVLPVFADYTCSLTRLRGALADYVRKVAFFPGSTIGNMEPPQARGFLRECSGFLGTSGKILVGFDLVKQVKVLEAAYNDAAGLTAQFNLNLLERMNRELGADFRLDRFQHHAFFNLTESRIEMHLVSLQDQQVEVAGRLIDFGEEESIHTENSYKYSVQSFACLAEESGFSVSRIWTDEYGSFAVALLEAQSTSAGAVHGGGYGVGHSQAQAVGQDWSWAS